MATVTVLVGSTYGNTQQIADDCMAYLRQQGHRVTQVRDYAAFVKDKPEHVLICCASIGQGEIPDNLMPLYCELKDRLPQLPYVRYGVISAGDSSYVHFAGGSTLMTALFEEMRCQRVIDTLLLDECETDDPEAEVAAWIKRFACYCK